MTVRVRFAPSPTGYLHIGGARTALFNWLYARHTGGQFVLRIEDTDAARNSQEAVEVILNGLRWLGLDWDEGPATPDATATGKGAHGPYFQSQRKARYQARVEELLSKGLAYEHEGALKFRMTREPVIIPDMVVGDVRRELTDREVDDPDFVIIRSDGQPVFHFVNVVDDLEMGITHVIRGEDHLTNTAKHIELFKALGAEPPRYAHIPLILNADGSKMSKRDTGASLTYYMENDYEPAAVLNYLCLLGWSPKANREVMPLADVVKLFDLPQINRSNARFDLTKLDWMNGEYLRQVTGEPFYERGLRALKTAGVNTGGFPESYLRAALKTCETKIKLFSELKDYAGFYFQDEFPVDAEAAKAQFTDENKSRVRRLCEALEKAASWDAATLEACLKSTATELGVKAGVLVHPVRLALTGRTAGPSLYHLMEILGRDKALGRLNRVLRASS